MDTTKIDWIIANRTNYYAVLGVEKTSSMATIRRSYHRLTLQLHPDKTNGNRHAEDACRAVIRAYEVLKNEELRNIYDMEGDRGVEFFENRGVLPFDNFVRILFWYLVAKLLENAARGTNTLDILEKRMSWFREFVPRREGDNFGRSSRGPRRASRYFVAYAFAMLLLVTICTVTGLRLRYRSDSSAYTHTDAFESMLHKSHDEAMDIYMYHQPSNRTVAVCRPVTTSDETAERLVNQWVTLNCPRESLLRWASRERYKPTATLRVRQKLSARPTPNRVTRRKWVARNWRPKFTESFSVKSTDQLFTRSPLCSIHSS